MDRQACGRRSLPATAAETWAFLRYTHTSHPYNAARDPLVDKEFINVVDIYIHTHTPSLHSCLLMGYEYFRKALHKYIECKLYFCFIFYLLHFLYFTTVY